MKIKCPNCKHEIDINIGQLIGSKTSDKKAKSSRETGKKGGGRKKGRKAEKS